MFVSFSYRVILKMRYEAGVIFQHSYTYIGTWESYLSFGNTDSEIALLKYDPGLLVYVEYEKSSHETSLDLDSRFDHNRV